MACRGLDRPEFSFVSPGLRKVADGDLTTACTWQSAPLRGWMKQENTNPLKNLAQGRKSDGSFSTRVSGLPSPVRETEL